MDDLISRPMMNSSRRQFLKQTLILSPLSVVSSLPSLAAPAPARTGNPLGMFVYLDGKEPALDGILWEPGLELVEVG